MSTSTTLYQKSRKGAVKVWTLKRKGDTLETIWGQKNGKMQTTSDVIKPKGKTGTKAYKNAEEQAKLEYDRTIVAMRERGYVDDEKALVDIEDMSEFTFDTPPTGFCPPKPIKQEPKNDAIEALIASGNAWLQKKYDGGRVLVFVDSKGEVRLFTRTLEPCSLHFKQITAAFQEIAAKQKLYDCVFDAELIIGAGEKIEHFDLINGLMPNTKPETAQAKITELETYDYNRKRETLHLRCIAFDTIFFCGRYMLQEAYSDRYAVLVGLGLQCDDGTIPNQYYSPSQRILLPQLFKTTTFKEYQAAYDKLNKTVDFEGYILRDSTSTSSATLNGKEVRPYGCWKVKKIQEDDFVVTGYDLGTGKNSAVVGRFNLIQYDGAGRVVDCGNCGTIEGSEELRAEALDWKYPVVARVRFDRRQVDGKIRFPRFVAKRDDKKPTECLYQKK